VRKYEVVFIFKVLEEEATNTVVAKFENLIKNNGGEIEKIDRWGKKRLAYEIKDVADGYYVLVHFNSEPATVKELDRVAKITEEVLKHMIVKVDEK
jgi:small subunit ribosomal protein S6